MSTTDLWFDDLSDDERLAELARSRKQLRGASNPLEMASTDFLKNFRLSKEAFMDLLSSAENQLKQCTRAKSILNILKLATVLRLYDQGSYQLSIGMLGLAQPTVSVVLSEIIDVLENYICQRWKQFSSTEADLQQRKAHFYSKYSIRDEIS